MSDRGSNFGERVLIQPVILCGGSGTRLWPLSREQYPKQLLCLSGNMTMLQATTLRLQDMTLDNGVLLLPPLMVGNEEYRFLVAEQLREIGVEAAALILEPVGRNTAPALALAAHQAMATGKDPVLIVMPADHVIQDEVAFRAAVVKAAPLADAGYLVTFGVTPTAPETGYGYIHVGDVLVEGGYLVRQFIEKPDALTAKAYLNSGEFLWNGGIFAIKASIWLSKLTQIRPTIAKACTDAFVGRVCDRDFVRPDQAAFIASPSESIDYAVMEPLTSVVANQGEVVVLPLSAQWSDVGAWSALWEIGEKDASGNVFRGDTIAVDTKNTLVMANTRLVACVGVDNAVVVETPDAVLVADRSKIQQVKEVVNRLKAESRPEGRAHRKVYRPWGWYDSVDKGDRFQVKRLVVNPGASLSLQMHHHRAEHWIVVSGTALVTRGEDTFIVSENESTFIPLGTTHRLENPGRLPLEMIEVQSGSYLGEDDIVRFDDRYGRES